jgi:hypothetical protein
MNVLGFLWNTVTNIYYMFFPDKKSIIPLLKYEEECINNAVNDSINSRRDKAYLNMKLNTANKSIMLGNNVNYVFIFDDNYYDDSEDVGGIW